MFIRPKSLAAFLLMSCVPMAGTASPWAAEISFADNFADDRSLQGVVVLPYNVQSSVPSGPWLVSGLYTTASDGPASCSDALHLYGEIFVGEGERFQVRMDLAFDLIDDAWVANEPVVSYHAYLPNGEVDHGYETYTGIRAILLSFTCTDNDMASIEFSLEVNPVLIEGSGPDVIRIFVEFNGDIPVRKGAY